MKKMGRDLSFEICLGEDCSLKLDLDDETCCDCKTKSCSTLVRNSSLVYPLFKKFEKEGDGFSGHLTYEELQTILLSFLEKYSKLDCFLFGRMADFNSDFSPEDFPSIDIMDIKFYSEIVNILFKMKVEDAKCVWFYYN